MTTGALEGFVCIDVSGHVAGPYAGSLLGDLGWDFTKVELWSGGSIFAFAGVQEIRSYRSKRSPLVKGDK